MALRTLAGIASSGESEAARVSAAIHLLDRGWGRVPQTHTGEDDIRITIRHIVEGRDKALDAKTIDATSVRHEIRNGEETR